ncbi:hypothetical protein BU25DRAFT_73565 [Macroventuria anomochaeta]|uniref:Uncharacterized protein n=1 Tax=Macroventuria anomochaeta TaxID=301207 RepID=A0ACB6RZL0_9PLEO|nr:uncharacterized protein BU25DRAFT_73565 [Macroventuria anomochaeta]KAF2626845.1 hypothetical protein BU25DRAFT_73565 [Macroventuria anomochaeta]
MSLPEPPLVIPSISSLSLNDLPIDHPRSVLGNRGMSLPHERKRLRAFRPLSLKRRKLSRESVVSSQHQDDTSPDSATSPASNDVKCQATVTVVPQDPFPEEPIRKRDRIQQWLVQQAQRVERLKQEVFRHRDSKFDRQDIEKELKQATLDANATVVGPDGEEVSQRVINHFFTLYPAGGSDWLDSKRWERHLAKCSQIKCDHCKATQRPGDRSPSPLKSSPLQSSRSSSPKSTKSPKEPKSSADGYFSNPFWRSRSSKRREEKGKSPAPDELGECTTSPLHEVLLSPRTQLSERLPDRPRRASRPPKGSIVIRDAYQYTQRKPVRCSIISSSLDPSQIPIPAIPDLKPADSSGLDLHDLAHVTGHSYGGSPLEDGRLPFPLCHNFIPPPAPLLRPEQRITPIPDTLQLEEASRVSSSGRPIFDMSPLVSASPGATNVQRGFHPPPAVRTPFRPVFPDEEYTIADVLGDGIEMPRLRKCGPAPAPAPAAAPAVQFPPTPPDSRQNSTSYPSGVSYTTYGDTISLPAKPTSVPEGPADRDWDMCELSDTTGSSLPDCPVYVNPRQARGEWWDGMAERYGPGMNYWR